jgi:hypothetical protein
VTVAAAASSSETAAAAPFTVASIEDIAQMITGDGAGHENEMLERQAYPVHCGNVDVGRRVGRWHRWWHRRWQRGRR